MLLLSASSGLLIESYRLTTAADRYELLFWRTIANNSPNVRSLYANGFSLISPWSRASGEYIGGNETRRKKANNTRWHAEWLTLLLSLRNFPRRGTFKEVSENSNGNHWRRNDRFVLTRWAEASSSFLSGYHRHPLSLKVRRNFCETILLRDVTVTLVDKSPPVIIMPRMNDE